MANLRKVGKKMKTVRSETVEQDNSVLIGEIKESVKQKDRNVEGCRR